MQQIWAELFLRSSFCVTQERLDVDVRRKSQKSFLLGRACAAKALNQLQVVDVEIGRSEDRTPKWPNGIVGSISHSDNWTGAAVARSADLQAVGMDFETVGRITDQIASKVLTNRDIESYEGLNQQELWTLIFSAKESLFKALYPIHKEFFYFDAAFVAKVDSEKGSFQISIDPSRASLSLNGCLSFSGRFKIHQGTCLTVIEVPLF